MAIGVSLALKPTQKLAGQRDMEKTNRMPNLALLPDFSPVENNGPVAI